MIFTRTPLCAVLRRLQHWVFLPLERTRGSGDLGGKVGDATTKQISSVGKELWPGHGDLLVFATKQYFSSSPDDVS